MGYLFLDKPVVTLRCAGADNGLYRWSYRIEEDGRFTSGEFYATSLRVAHRLLGRIVKRPNRQVWIQAPNEKTYSAPPVPAHFLLSERDQPKIDLNICSILTRKKEQ